MAKIQWHVAYIFGLVGITLLSFHFATKVVMIVFASILLSLLLQPVKTRFERRVSSGVATLFALLLFVGAAGVFISWIIENLLPGLKQLASNAPGLINRQTISEWIMSLNLPIEISEYANNLLDNAREFAVNAMKNSLLPAMNALSGIVEMIAIPFITFYLLKDSGKLREIAVSFVPFGEREPIQAFFADTADMLGGYIKGQVLVCLTFGCSVFLFFLILKLPYAAVFAALSAVGELIPVLGPVTVTLFAVMFGLTFSTATAVKIFLFYVIMLKVNNTLVYPHLIGKAVRLHPVFIMIGLLLFGSLFGALGMIVAVPSMGLIRVILAHVLPKRYEDASS